MARITKTERLLNLVSYLLKERRPVHRRIWLRAFDGVDRALETTAFPLEAAEGHLVGGVVMFWEQRRQ